MTSHWLDETFELEGRVKYDSLISDFLTSDFWVNFVLQYTFNKGDGIL